MKINLDKSLMKDSLTLACLWITDIGMNHQLDIQPEANKWLYNFSSWKGSMLEYDVREKNWVVYAPIWHTGQAVKALVLAYRVLKDKQLLDFAREGADFILRERINDKQDPDFGALLSYEADEGPGALIANTSGMLEALDGLIFLGNETGEDKYWDAVIACLDWIERRMVIKDDPGLFDDRFSLKDRQVGPLRHILLRGLRGRPLLDDGVFLKGYHKTGRKSYLDIYFNTANRLLKDELPLGNWIKYPPANIDRGTIHPRHAFWWGRPLIMGWLEAKATGCCECPELYLECAKRSAQWYAKAQRMDGGIFRTTYLDFNTLSFGHATSGILSACSLWRDLILEGEGDEYRENLKLALNFAKSMQFTHTADPNLHGAILEKILPPDGTDKVPYNIRDLSNIFYVQALSMAIMDDLL